MTRPDRSRDAAAVFLNGTVLTMAGGDGAASAGGVAVDRAGRILAVAGASEIGEFAEPGVRTIDLGGRTLIPGFFDCHMHLLWLGRNLSNVSLASPPVRDRDDVVRLLRGRRAAEPEATLIQGNFYDQNRLPDGRHLTRADLDLVATDIPVRIEHTSGHAAVVNSRALALLGITRDTPNPAGGEIERDAAGEPTGLLLETASWNNLNRIVPDLTPGQAVEALGRTDRYLLERGVTSATDADTMPREIGWYADAALAGCLRVRTNCMVAWETVLLHAGDSAAPSPVDLQPTRAGLDGHRLHVGQAKLFSDGAITTRTCLLSEPLEGVPDNYGIAMHDEENLRQMIRRAHEAGWQVATHAIGDKAIDLVLAAYAAAQRAAPRNRPDHRIEHCMLLNDGLIARMRRQHVWSIGQPEFLTALGDAYFAALGEERANRLSPYATLDARGIAQAFSSDCPVVPGAPLDGIRAAVDRKTRSGRAIGAAEALTVEAALYAYTAAPAFASRVERDRGTIEPGKWADFAVLSRNPLNTPLDEWDDLRVVATYVAGECLYG
ncbi:MAG TPA: amidohydrolase [Chthonomonadaceae bacterium]|nr:amidohydrolase [Chthonomonadaceae bacterium]